MNYSGLWYRVIAECLLMIVIISVAIFFEAKRTPKRKDRLIVLSASIALFVGIASLYLYRIACGDTAVYSGQFVVSRRNSRVAPPLPLTSEYVFQCGDIKKTFYLDELSKRSIYPGEFEEGSHYVVCYDRLTRVILSVQEMP